MLVLRFELRQPRAALVGRPSWSPMCRDAVPKIAAGGNIRDLLPSPPADKQSARFGSRGEGYAPAKRLR